MLNWSSMKYFILDFSINSAARRVLAEAGPMSKTVVDTMTETADTRLTPSWISTGKTEAISNSPKPVAEGMGMDKKCPIGMTSDAAR